VSTLVHSDPQEFIVVGGGIGGLATALAIATAGRPARVLERAERFAEVGAGLQLAPNATRLLARLGVLDHVLDAGVTPARLVIADARTGEGLVSTDLGERFRQHYGAPYVVLHRADLLAILLDACKQVGVCLESDRAVTGVETEDHGARVTCASGLVYEGRAVIGADGLRSALRTGFDASPPVPSGYVAYRGAIPIEDVDRPHDLDTVIAWVGPGMHLVQYPVRAGELYNQVAVCKVAGDVADAALISTATSAGSATEGTRAELLAAFATACEPVRRALPSLEANFRWPIYDREPLSRWTHGRIALLGDAAHPSQQYLAQGACQAIEDATVLADQLAEYDDPAGPDESAGIERAFAAYEFIRQPRTATVQRSARVWGDIWHLADPTALTVRNELFRRVPDDDYAHAEWLWGWTPPRQRRNGIRPTRLSTPKDA
jgi:2-polyprenyl-6-methoxyphenol hydroxylase-like FAD-dependent oxidoreductase